MCKSTGGRDSLAEPEPRGHAVIVVLCAFCLGFLIKDLHRRCFTLIAFSEIYQTHNPSMLTAYASRGECQTKEDNQCDGPYDHPAVQAMPQ